MSRSSTKHGSLFRNALGPKQPPRGNVIPSLVSSGKGFYLGIKQI
jgi:hypothetical protein